MIKEQLSEPLRGKRCFEAGKDEEGRNYVLQTKIVPCHDFYKGLLDKKVIDENGHSVDSVGHQV